MSARRSKEHADEHRSSAGEKEKNKTGRHAPRIPRVTVADPCITVVESTEPADRAALHTAITLFVKWAIRAHASPPVPPTQRPPRPQLTT